MITFRFLFHKLSLLGLISFVPVERQKRALNTPSKSCMYILCKRVKYISFCSFTRTKRYEKANKMLWNISVQTKFSTLVFTSRFHDTAHFYFLSNLPIIIPRIPIRCQMYLLLVPRGETRRNMILEIWFSRTRETEAISETESEISNSSFLFAKHIIDTCDIALLIRKVSRL